MGGFVANFHELMCFCSLSSVALHRRRVLVSVPVRDCSRLMIWTGLPDFSFKAPSCVITMTCSFFNGWCGRTESGV